MKARIVISILPQEVTDIEGRIAELMERYSEKINVPEYKKQCYCIGSKARQKAYEFADKTVGTIDSYRERFKQIHKDKNEKWWYTDEFADLWMEFIQPYVDAKTKYLATSPDKDSVDPECGSCEGTGFYKTTYNPDSKWDWYVIGGRWDGDIQNKPRESMEGYCLLKYNKVDVSFLIENKLIPFAILTPDGQWLEQGRMGWWGIVSNKKTQKEWSKVVLDVYEKYKKRLHCSRIRLSHLSHFQIERSKFGFKEVNGCTIFDPESKTSVFCQVYSSEISDIHHWAKIAKEIFYDVNLDEPEQIHKYHLRYYVEIPVGYATTFDIIDIRQGSYVNKKFEAFKEV